MTTTDLHAGITWPDFLTVEQAAAIVRIGRSAAYELAREFLRTGCDGLPVVRVGRQLRVPRVVLERWLGGPLTPPPDPKPSTPAKRASTKPTTTRRTRRGDQPALPLDV